MLLKLGGQQAEGRRERRTHVRPQRWDENGWAWFVVENDWLVQPKQLESAYTWITYVCMYSGDDCQETEDVVAHDPLIIDAGSRALESPLRTGHSGEEILDSLYLVSLMLSRGGGVTRKCCSGSMKVVRFFVCL